MNNTTYNLHIHHLKELRNTYEDPEDFQNFTKYNMNFEDNYIFIKHFNDYGTYIVGYDNFKTYFIHVTKETIISSFCVFSGNNINLKKSEGLFEDIYSNRTEFYINGEYNGTGDEKIDQIIKSISKLILEIGVIPSLRNFIQSDETLTLILKAEVDIAEQHILKEIIPGDKKPIIFTDGGDPWDLFITNEYNDVLNLKDYFEKYHQTPLNKDKFLEIYDIEYSGFIIPPDEMQETEPPFKSEDDVINYILYTLNISQVSASC